MREIYIKNSQYYSARTDFILLRHGSYLLKQDIWSWRRGGGSKIRRDTCTLCFCWMMQSDAQNNNLSLQSHDPYHMSPTHQQIKTGVTYFFHIVKWTVSQWAKTRKKFHFGKTILPQRLKSTFFEKFSSGRFPKGTWSEEKKIQKMLTFSLCGNRATTYP